MAPLCSMGREFDGSQVGLHFEPCPHKSVQRITIIPRPGHLQEDDVTYWLCASHLAQLQRLFPGRVPFEPGEN